MKPEEQFRKINKIIAKSWQDDEFKARLVADPTASLRQEGVEIPPGVEMRVVADTDSVRYLRLPLKPSTEELSDQQLTQVVGGDCAATAIICKSACNGDICYCVCSGGSGL
jgi:hypothetical protein